MKLLLMATLPLLMLLATTEVGASNPCPGLHLDDPAGDHVGVAPIPAPIGDAGTLDVLGLTVNRTDEGLRFTVQLAGDPRQQDDAINYYWVNIQGATAAGGNPSQWTMQVTSTYVWMETMYWDNFTSGFPVEWVGTTFSFEVPWTAFYEQFGANWSTAGLGSPRVSTSGPYLPIEVAGTGTDLSLPLQQGDDADYYPEEVALPPCPVVKSPEGFEPPTVKSAGNGTASAPAGASSTGGKTVPLAFLLAPAALAAVAAILRRR